MNPIASETHIKLYKVLDLSHSGLSIGRCSLTRPKSFVVSSLSTRLLSLEEAQARTQAAAHLLCSEQAALLALQGHADAFHGKFHTVLDLPADRRKSGFKVRKSAGGSWKTFFAIGKPGSARRKPTRIGSLFQPETSQTGTRVDTVTLRSAKSEESLCSQHSGAGLSKLQRLRRPRSSSDALSVTMEAELLPALKLSRSYDSLQAEDPEGVYMLPDFSQETALWMAEDEMDFSPTFLEEAVGAGELDLPSPPPAFRCRPHQHLHRPITEDPDSLLNQSEAAARKSLLVAAVNAAAVQAAVAAAASSSSSAALPPPHSQSCCQHRGPQPGELTSPPHDRKSFTRKVVHALSPKGSKSPPLDISDPIAISVPAKVLEMIGGRAGEFQAGPQSSGPTHPPQMISMLLKSCDIQLTESCQQEIRNKLAQGSDPSVKGMLMPATTLPSQMPPPPPPKNPARLMALALAESANEALKQASGPQRNLRPQGKPHEALEARFMRSLSVDSSEVLSSLNNPLYSTVRPLSVWRPEEESSDTAEGPQRDRSQPQDTCTLSSQTSLSESGASTSEVSASSSSGETEAGQACRNQQAKTPSVTSSTACQPSEKALERPVLSQGPAESQPQARKPPAYSRQFSAPHLQHKLPSSSSSLKVGPHSQLHHSKSECSPMAQLRAFQPTRPKVPPKPPELGSVRATLSRGESYSRRSLDQSRTRRLLASQATTPLSRADSERVSGVDPGRELPPYHGRAASSPAQGKADDQSKNENFYYEIAPEPQVLPSPARYGYQPAGIRFEGPSYRSARLDPDLTERGMRAHSMGVRPHFWAADPRTWAMQAAGHSLVPFSQIPLDGPPHPSTVRMVPISRTEVQPHQGGSAYQRNLYRAQRSPSGDPTASQLHPYFENGKVCYRYFEANQEAFLADPRAQQPPSNNQTSPPKHSRQEQPEPIYVNFPFNPGKTWTTTDLDGDSQKILPPSPSEGPGDGHPNEHPPVFDESPRSKKTSSHYDNLSASLDEDEGSSEAAAHFRSRSDPQNSTSEGPREVPAPEGKEAPASETTSTGESGNEMRCVIATSTEGPPPQEQHSHTFNVYTPGPSRPPFQGQGVPRGAVTFLRQDALRRSSSGGHYRQAFDVMPSGDQVLKFYRATQDFTSLPPSPGTCDSLPPHRPAYEDPYPGHQQDSRPLYAQQAPQDPSVPPQFASLAHLSMTTASSPRGYNPGGFRSMANQYNAYQFQSVPMLTQYANVPRREPLLDPSLHPNLRNQTGLTRQGSLRGPNWTVHTEGQTRSYC